MSTKEERISRSVQRALQDGTAVLRARDTKTVGKLLIGLRARLPRLAADDPVKAQCEAAISALDEELKSR